jgi:hypothetical protein
MILVLLGEVHHILHKNKLMKLKSYSGNYEQVCISPILK